MKVHAFLHYEHSPWDEACMFKLYPFNMSNADKSLILMGEVEAEVPDTEVPSKLEITTKIIATLKEEKQQILSDTHDKVARIDQQIQELLCLPNMAEPL